MTHCYNRYCRYLNSLLLLMLRSCNMSYVRVTHYFGQNRDFPFLEMIGRIYYSIKPTQFLSIRVVHAKVIWAFTYIHCWGIICKNIRTNRKTIARTDQHKGYDTSSDIYNDTAYTNSKTMTPQVHLAPIRVRCTNPNFFFSLSTLPEMKTDSD